MSEMEQESEERVYFGSLEEQELQRIIEEDKRR